MKRSEVLQNADAITSGDREQDYGSPEDNFKRIAAMWSAYTCADISAKDVAAMMILVKIARVASGNAKNDNWIDIAGYAACGGEIESKGNAETIFLGKCEVTIDER